MAFHVLMIPTYFVVRCTFKHINIEVTSYDVFIVV